MATLTIRNIDDNLRDRIAQKAADNGRSMEEEVRQLLRSTYAITSLGDALLEMGKEIRALGGVELDIPPRRRDRGAADLFKDWEAKQ